MRLSEARARAELRDIVTIGDAQDVIDLMHFCLLDNLVDEVNGLGHSRAGSRSEQVITCKGRYPAHAGRSSVTSDHRKAERSH